MNFSPPFCFRWSNLDARGQKKKNRPLNSCEKVENKQTYKGQGIRLWLLIGNAHKIWASSKLSERTQRKYTASSPYLIMSLTAFYKIDCNSGEASRSHSCPSLSSPPQWSLRVGFLLLPLPLFFSSSPKS